MATVSYDEILQQLDAFLAFCRELGLGNELQSSRFSTYRQLLVDLIVTVDRLKAADLAEPNRTNIVNRMPEYLTAIEDSREIGDTLAFLRTCDSDVLTGPLRKVLAGPLLPAEEDPKSNQSRNIVFELVLGATLWRAGVSVQPAEPDLQCNLAGGTVFIACKRIFSLEKLVRRINEATRQLRARLHTQSRDARGVIAISLSKVLNPARRLETVRNQNIGRELLQRQIETLVQKRAKWQASREAEAIIFHAGSIFSNLDAGHIDVGGFFVLYGTSPITAALGQALNRVAH